MSVFEKGNKLNLFLLHLKCLGEERKTLGKGLLKWQLASSDPGNSLAILFMFELHQYRNIKDPQLKTDNECDPFS